MPRKSLARRLSRRDSLAILLVGIGISVLVAVLGAWKASPIVRTDNLLVDAYLRASATGEQAQRTVVVDIDDVSLSAVGQWPWPRYRVAALIQRIAAEQPAAIALDILFPEPDRSSLVSIQQTFKRDFDLYITFSGVPAGLLDNDGFLGEEIGRARVVASNYFYFDHVSKIDTSPQPGLKFGGRTELLGAPEATGVLVNAPSIATQTRFSGFVNNRLDDDGVLRRLPLLIRHEGVLHPNLSLAAVMRAMGVTSGSIEVGDNGLALRIGDRRVPIDPDGSAMLRFNGKPLLYKAISAVDVLNGRYSHSDLQGKIVFIGTSAVGLNDHHNTALARSFPGLKIQSVMAENMLDAHFASVPSWGAAAIFMACLLVGTLISTMFVVSTGIYPMIAGSVLTCASVLTAGYILFLRSGRFVPIAAPLLLVATLFITFVLIRFAIERRRAYLAQKQLENARQVTIEAMASVAETRDPETGAHIKRTQNYVRAIAQELQRSGHYTAILSDEFIELLYISAPLHDIGKVGVPDHILLKPGRLTAQEMELMKLHAEFGRKIIFSTAARIDGDNFLTVAGEIAATHHEKWDGSGYPKGLAGQDIPLSGRIMAVADIYDALISRRCYKEPFPHALAITMMQEGRGRTFDPVVLDAFFRIEGTVKEIAERFKDESEHAEGPAALTARLVGSLTRTDDSAVPMTRVTVEMARDRAL